MERKTKIVSCLLCLIFLLLLNSCQNGEGQTPTEDKTPRETVELQESEASSKVQNETGLPTYRSYTGSGKIQITEGLFPEGPIALVIVPKDAPDDGGIFALDEAEIEEIIALVRTDLPRKTEDYKSAGMLKLHFSNGMILSLYDENICGIFQERLEDDISPVYYGDWTTPAGLYEYVRELAQQYKG